MHESQLPIPKDIQRSALSGYPYVKIRAKNGKFELKALF